MRVPNTASPPPTTAFSGSVTPTRCSPRSRSSSPVRDGRPIPTAYRGARGSARPADRDPRLAHGQGPRHRIWFLLHRPWRPRAERRPRSVDAVRRHRPIEPVARLQAASGSTRAEGFRPCRSANRRSRSPAVASYRHAPRPVEERACLSAPNGPPLRTRTRPDDRSGRQPARQTRASPRACPSGRRLGRSSPGEAEAGQKCRCWPRVAGDESP
jgi:hypothetical protein